jgi:hypothetical protein
MNRDRIDVRDELTLDDFEGLEVIELPERELMCGCGGTGLLGGLLGGIGSAPSAGVGVSANVSVALGIGAGGSTSCGS